ncbi:MAG: hypothetical protein ACR2JZ_04330 [Candidatus Limnocylindrales bacterium]
MDEETVRKHAQALCDALVAGDMDRVIEHLSKELRQNLGEVLVLLPLPATEAAVESVDRGGSSIMIVLRVVGETDEVQIQTRWKQRDDRPTIVEASHLSQTVLAAPAEAEGEDAAGETGVTS